MQRQIDEYVVYVYSLEMIAAEKLRAICQQMTEYWLGTKTPRARDFYDIYQIVEGNGIDLTTEKNQFTIGAVFAAKDVPLKLLDNIAKYRDFHALDWPEVVTSISGKHESFDFYFDFVVSLASKLKTLWIK